MDPLVNPSMNLKIIDDGPPVSSSTSVVKNKEDLKKMPTGKPKSGRVWKTHKDRFSSFRIPKAVKKTFNQHKTERDQKRAVKLYERELKEKRAKDLEAKRKRAEENKTRRLENQRKAEIVQPIKNTAKLKRMKKKHLRNIEKR